MYKKLEKSILGEFFYDFKTSQTKKGEEAIEATLKSISGKVTMVMSLPAGASFLSKEVQRLLLERLVVDLQWQDEDPEVSVSTVLSKRECKYILAKVKTRLAQAKARESV